MAFPQKFIFTGMTLQYAATPPFVQPVPERHAGAPHFLGKVLPRNAGLENEQHPAQAQAVALAGLSTLGTGLPWGKERCGQSPQFVRNH